MEILLLVVMGLVASSVSAAVELDDTGPFSESGLDSGAFVGASVVIGVLLFSAAASAGFSPGFSGAVSEALEVVVVFANFAVA